MYLTASRNKSPLEHLCLTRAEGQDVAELRIRIQVDTRQLVLYPGKRLQPTCLMSVHKCFHSALNLHPFVEVAK